MRARRLGLARLGQYAVVLVVAVSLNFALPRLMPGSPLALIAGVEVGEMTAEERAAVTADAGLDEPLVVQYLSYWKSILTLDFGYSFRQGTPIEELVLDRVPWTLLLTLTALVVSAVIGIALGAFAAWRRGGAWDVSSLAVMIALESTPQFWLGMLFIALFSVSLGWLPSFGATTAGADLTGFAWLADVAEHAVLPVLTLSILSIPAVYLSMRYSTLSVLGEDYIRTAQAKGLRPRAVMLHHVVRTALLPVTTVLALRLGWAFGGTVVIETVFSYPGLGRLMYDAVSARDYPVMQATFLVFTIAVLLANLLADSLYPRLDPRTRV
ncbi:ABC transporter permease [Jiangella alba]|uniref:Peptide/nickel transport system permease protein n=1 Tax=Jiangella alba TaxID=561176 RepID=A0A1H5PYT3_9ACTN|nr:ABC transporter permease [Jiangella alba]SEF18966.1 peptide/nickel transport system permease protein [Jiangella alba]